MKRNTWTNSTTLNTLLVYISRHNSAEKANIYSVNISLFSIIQCMGILICNNSAPKFRGFTLFLTCMVACASAALMIASGTGHFKAAHWLQNLGWLTAVSSPSAKYSRLGLPKTTMLCRWIFKDIKIAWASLPRWRGRLIIPMLLTYILMRWLVSWKQI